MSLPCQRSRFDIPDDIHYLNCAYMAPLADSVMAAIEAGTALKRQPWTYRAADFFTHTERFRTHAAHLLGTGADNVAIVPSVSYGLACAAQNLPFTAGQEVVVLADQFPSNVYPWRELAAARGGRVVTAARHGGMDWTQAVLAAIGEATAIVAVPQCHWADGGALDLSALGKACRETGAAFVLDLTQSLGAQPMDLDEVQPDFLVAACYKWLLGPYGIGILYVAPRHQDGTPLEQNWMNRAGAENFVRLVDYRDEYAAGARRFDMGEKANPPLLMGAAAALELIEEWGGPQRITAALGARTADLAERARGLGLTARDVPERAPHFLSLGFPEGVPDDLPERLAKENIFISLRGKSLRVTPHLWVNDADCEHLIDVLGAALR